MKRKAEPEMNWPAIVMTVLRDRRDHHWCRPYEPTIEDAEAICKAAFTDLKRSPPAAFDRLEKAISQPATFEEIVKAILSQPAEFDRLQKAFSEFETEHGLRI